MCSRGNSRSRSQELGAGANEIAEDKNHSSSYLLAPSSHPSLYLPAPRGHPLRGGREGLSSTRLARLREFNVMRSTTTSAPSSGALFQSASPPNPRSPKPVETEPGIT